jgi:hypothetical protein
MMDVGRDFERMRDYIAGRMSDEERRAFDDRLLLEPGLVRELEESLRLREGFEQLRAQGYFRQRAWRPQVARWLLPALAAAAIAGIAFLLRAQLGTAPLPGLSATPEANSSSITARFTFVSMRNDAVPDLSLPSSGLIEFRAAPPLRHTPGAYRATLAREESGSSRIVGTLGGIAPSADGYVHSYADASRLEGGGYVLRVEGDGEKAAVSEFRFALRAAR